MKEIIIPVLLLLGVVIPVTSQMDSVQLVSFSRSRKVKDGPVMCAVDAANETKTSSLQYCLRDCARDGTCTNFNIKNSDVISITTNRECSWLCQVAKTTRCQSYTVSHIITHIFDCSQQTM